MGTIEGEDVGAGGGATQTQTRRRRRSAREQTRRKGVHHFQRWQDEDFEHCQDEHSEDTARREAEDAKREVRHGEVGGSGVKFDLRDVGAGAGSELEGGAGRTHCGYRRCQAAKECAGSIKQHTAGESIKVTSKDGVAEPVAAAGEAVGNTDVGTQVLQHLNSCTPCEDEAQRDSGAIQQNG